MDQLFFIGRGRVEWRDIPEPDLVDASDALVRPIAVATCDLDTMLVHGDAPFQGPFPLGHEGVGEVVAVGADVASVRIGDRVIIPFQVSCGTCSRCVRGRTAHCEATNPGAMYGLEPFGGPWGGFFSDAVRVPWADHMLVQLPDGVDPLAVASLSDNICDGWRTVAPYIEAATSLPASPATASRSRRHSASRRWTFWTSENHPPRAPARRNDSEPTSSPTPTTSSGTATRSPSARARTSPRCT